MINVCIPVLNNYEGLLKCVQSVRDSNIKVDGIYIVDNGGKIDHSLYPDTVICEPGINLGVAASWNWFIKNCSEYRIICNDDIEFEKDSIKLLIESYSRESLIFPNNSSLNTMNAFSCFLLPQTIIDVVGLFDEWISPNYGYFEDNDYYYRMSLKGFYIKDSRAVVNHVGSATLKNFSIDREAAHHERFRAAEKRYIQKWGGKPEHERYTTEFGR